LVLKEPELFAFLKEFYYPDISKSNGKFSHYDCLTHEHKMYMELKSRKTHYDDLLIEKDKYDHLMSGAFFFGYMPAYVNSTPQGVWLFDLKELPEPEWEDRWLPAKTEFPSGGNKTKVVGYLHIKDGKQL
jgi:hypothetical protein